MSQYIDDDCIGCDAYIEPYGCIDHYCPIYKAWEASRKEDRMESRIHPIFDEILKPFIGGDK